MPLVDVIQVADFATVPEGQALDPRLNKYIRVDAQDLGTPAGKSLPKTAVAGMSSATDLIISGLP
jgi:hypothetical protein